jgi:hypothetical protein
MPVGAKTTPLPRPEGQGFIVTRATGATSTIRGTLHPQDLRLQSP